MKVIVRIQKKKRLYTKKTKRTIRTILHHSKKTTRPTKKEKENKANDFSQTFHPTNNHTNKDLNEIHTVRQ